MASSSIDFNLCDYPAGTPPEGTSPNFDNPVSLDATALSVEVTLTTLATLIVISRIYVNRTQLHLADYFMGVGAVFNIAYTGLIASVHKFARHEWDVPACWLGVHHSQVIFASSTIIYLVLFFPKCAILLFYRQLFHVHRPLRISVWIGLTACFAIYFTGIPLNVAINAPRPGQTWEQLLEHLAITGARDVIYWGAVQGFLSVGLDLYIFILPLPILFKLQMPRRRKIQLVALFSTGLFGIAASITGAVYRLGYVSTLGTTDFTWQEAVTNIWINVENNTIIIVGCMPAFAHLVRQVKAEISAMRSRSKSKLVASERYSYDPFQCNPTASLKSAEPSHPPGAWDNTSTMQLETQISSAGSHVTVWTETPDSHGISNV